jgi:glycosyltransferase involved in cell wall biosynthesis
MQDLRHLLAKKDMHEFFDIKETPKVAIIHNIIAPYKSLLFNELGTICPDLRVLYMAETESDRDWVIRKDFLDFPYDILFKGSLDDVSQVRVAVRTWRWLNQFGPDVVIIGGYNYFACLAGFFWAKVNRKKVILWFDSTEEDKPRIVLKEMIKRLLVKRCDGANAYSQKGKAYLMKLGMEEGRIFVKGNVTDNAFYFHQTMRLKKDRDLLSKKFGVRANNFLYIGRFSPEKNILFLLKVYQKLKTQKCDWGLILVGNGPERDKINDYINEYNIKDVYMPGFKQKEEMPEYLAVSDVLVLPSISETWGLVVNEAMAAGLPVLVSKRCGCYPDIVKEGVNGFSFEPHDETELHSRMKAIVDGKHDLASMGEASLEIIKDYTPERAARAVSEAIEYVSYS